MIQNYTKCEECEHNRVCCYKGIQKYVMSKMEGHLDNACAPEFFEFSFECKEFRREEKIKIDKCPFDY